MLASAISFLLGSLTGPTFYTIESDSVGISPDDIRAQEEINQEDVYHEFIEYNFASGTINTDLRKQLRQIFFASANLINIDIKPGALIQDHAYSGVVAEFCPLNWTAQKDNPSQFPLFKDIVKISQCEKGSKHIIRVKLHEVARLAREYDIFASNYGGSLASSVPILLDLKGVVSHESRCGSTLTSNSMIVLNPIKHRVYAESGLPEKAMKACGEDDPKHPKEGALNLLKDVLYMMGRSNDPLEENFFVVMQPESTRTQETFRKAFPTTPWIFLYRDPKEAIMSQGEYPAFSLKSSPMAMALVKREGSRIEDITIRAEKYAIHLATFCLSALRNLDDADGLGLTLRYSLDVAKDLVDTILPKHFHTPVDHDAKHRIMELSEEYDFAQDGLLPGPAGNKKKADIKSPNTTRQASKRFLAKSYKLLEESKYNVENCRYFRPGGVHLHCGDIYD